MHAVATPRKRDPSATRACGSWKRASNASRARPCAFSRPCRIGEPRGRVARACRSPTGRRRRARPSRRSAPAARHRARQRHRDRQRPARRVAADERDAVPPRERVEAGARIRRARARPRDGSVSASSAQAGSAPIAARSREVDRERAVAHEPARRNRTGNARPRPACRARAPSCRCRRRRDQRAVVADAGSTSSRRAPRPVKVPFDQLEFARHRGGHGDFAALGAASVRATRGRARRSRSLWPSVAPKRLAQLDAFVDHHAIRHLGRLSHELVERRARASRARPGSRRAGAIVGVARSSSSSPRALPRRSRRAPRGSTPRRPWRTPVVVRTGRQLGGRAAARAATGRAPARGACAPTPVPAPGRGPRTARQRASLRIRLASSTATRAASAPLLPSLPPARSTACSSVSVVSTPNATGTPVSLATRARPAAHSPAT